MLFAFTGPAGRIEPLPGDIDAFRVTIVDFVNQPHLVSTLCSRKDIVAHPIDHVSRVKRNVFSGFGPPGAA